MAGSSTTIQSLAKAASAYRSRAPRGPLPSQLWAMAMRLCRAGRPVGEVAEAGRMSVAALERRLGGSAQVRTRRAVRARARPAGFVALRSGLLSVLSVVEIERADGAKLRLPGLGAEEALALFLGGRA